MVGVFFSENSSTKDQFLNFLGRKKKRFKNRCLAKSDLMLTEPQKQRWFPRSDFSHPAMKKRRAQNLGIKDEGKVKVPCLYRRG